MTIAHARAEQLRCAAQYAGPGARLGLHDWFAEEFLIEEERKRGRLGVADDLRQARTAGGMAEGGEGMTAAEKAAHLEQFATYKTGCDKEFSDLLLKCAADFRCLIPDANGLLPCPMCGPDGQPVIIGTFPGDFNAACQTCLLRTGYCMTKADAIAAWNRRGGKVHA